MLNNYRFSLDRFTICNYFSNAENVYKIDSNSHDGWFANRPYIFGIIQEPVGARHAVPIGNKHRD